MSEDKIKILKMVAQKKISPEEGEELLNSLGSLEEKVKPSRWLRVKVWENDDGKEVDTSKKPKVNVNIPLALAKTVLKFIPDSVKGKISDKMNEHGDMGIDLNDLQLEKLIEEVKQFGSFTLVEVDDNDTKVVVVLE